MSVKPEIIKVKDKILLLKYKKKSDLARAFVRVQEHYESPVFEGKIFTIGEFRRWYADKFGTWSYYKDWTGFNVPVAMFQQFINGTFDPLTKQEKALVKIVRYLDPSYYIIAVHTTAPEDVYLHEVAHALYATDLAYREKVDQYFREYEDERDLEDPQDPGLEPLLAKMRELGYNEKVIRDECHAYMAASSAWLNENEVLYPIHLASRLKSNLLRAIE